MNKRKEEKLIRLAFGDLNEDLSLSCEERETVKEYEDLRKDLAVLRNIPDHQLSNERLRDALLGHGLKPAKEPVQSSENSWFVAMLAGSAIVLMFVVGARLHRSAAPAVIEGGAPGAVADNGKFNLKFPDVNELGSLTLPKLEEFPWKGATIHHAAHFSRRIVRVRHRDNSESRSGFDPLLTLNMGSSDPDSEFVPNKSTSESALASAKGVPADHTPPLDKVSSSPESKAIVEIDQDKDQETGARSAREVESKDVVVGG